MIWKALWEKYFCIDFPLCSPERWSAGGGPGAPERDLRGERTRGLPGAHCPHQLEQRMAGVSNLFAGEGKISWARCPGQVGGCVARGWCWGGGRAAAPHPQGTALVLEIGAPCSTRSTSSCGSDCQVELSLSPPFPCHSRDHMYPVPQGCATGQGFQPAPVHVTTRHLECVTRLLLCCGVTWRSWQHHGL